MVMLNRIQNNVICRLRLLVNTLMFLKKMGESSSHYNSPAKRKMNASESETEIEQGGTYVQKLNTLSERTCITFFQVSDDQKMQPSSAFVIQFTTHYKQGNMGHQKESPHPPEEGLRIIPYMLLMGLVGEQQLRLQHDSPFSEQRQPLND